MNNRIKLVRKTIYPKVSQEKFAEMLGTTRAAIATYELGKVIPSDTFIQLLCSKFNVNEAWLRNGTEPMFIEPDSFSLDQYAKERGASDEELEIIKAYFSMKKETREEVVKHFKACFATPKSTSVASNDSIDKEVEAYRQELIAEKKGQSVLPNTDGEKLA